VSKANGTMRAVQLVGWERPPEIVETARPAPGPGEVLLQVDATGLCHSDLHLMEWPEGTLPYELPFTLGHESTGTVAALGPGASGVAVGERVLVYGPWGCATCWQCSQGHESLCEHAAERRAHGAGLGRNGGLADFMVVPSARYLVPIGDLDPVEAAPLTDAALTPYHAIKRSAHQLRPNACVVVIGVGGLGHIAIQLLRALTGVRIVAVDLREDALALARDGGAHAAVSGQGLDPADLRQEAGGAGAGLVLDFVGSDATLALAAGVAAQGGDIAIVGIAGGTLPAGFGQIPLECSVAIPNWGTLPELIEVVALARSGAIRAEVERVALDDTLDAYRRLDRGEVVGRAVVVP
jgi:propanol-preferring alcohol dehydrogenase